VGLVTRPILVVLGFPVNVVIGSSKVAGVFGEWPGLYVLHKHKRVEWRLVFFLVVPMVLGSVLASIAVLTILKSRLDLVLGILLLLAGLFLLFKSKIGITEKNRRFPKSKTRTLSFCGTLPLSFFNTISGGLGPLFSLFYIWIYGKTFISSAALWRIASNIAAVISAIIFIVGGIIDWQLCIPLMLGLALGSYFGTKFGLKQGETWVRVVVLIVIFAGAIKLLFF
jgi:uncharacterized protein